jgi:hypothetical protein
MSVDTFSLARELRAADLAGPQAEAIAAAIGRAVTETSATKADLGTLRSELKADSVALRTEFKADLATLRSDVKADLEALRSSMLLWFIGTQVAVGALIVALVKL